MIMLRGIGLVYEHNEGVLPCLAFCTHRMCGRTRLSARAHRRTLTPASACFEIREGQTLGKGMDASLHMQLGLMYIQASRDCEIADKVACHFDRE